MTVNTLVKRFLAVSACFMCICSADTGFMTNYKNSTTSHTSGLSKKLLVARKGQFRIKCGGGSKLQAPLDGLVIAKGDDPGEKCGSGGCRALPNPDSLKKLLVAGKGKCGGNKCGGGGGSRLQAPLDGLVIAKGIAKGDDPGEKCGSEGCRTLPNPDFVRELLVAGGRNRCGRRGCRALPDPDSMRELFIVG